MAASSSTTPDPRNRDAARERARQVADQHARQDKRSRRILQLGILALVLVIVAVIGVVVAQNRAQQIPEAGPVPASANQWGGTVLTDVFGPAFAFEDATHEADGLPPRAYASFWEAAEEAGISRLYGGIHFRAAIERGLDQGRCIGAYANALKTRKQ